MPDGGKQNSLTDVLVKLPVAIGSRMKRCQACAELVPVLEASDLDVTRDFLCDKHDNFPGGQQHRFCEVCGSRVDTLFGQFKKGWLCDDCLIQRPFSNKRERLAFLDDLGRKRFFASIETQSLREAALSCLTWLTGLEDDPVTGCSEELNWSAIDPPNWDLLGIDTDGPPALYAFRPWLQPFVSAEDALKALNEALSFNEEGVAPSSSNSRIAAHPANSGYMRLFAEFWEIQFLDGPLCRLKNSSGLEYLDYFLFHPKTEHQTPVDVEIAAGKAAIPPAFVDQDIAIEAGLNVATGGIQWESPGGESASTPCENSLDSRYEDLEADVWLGRLRKNLDEDMMFDSPDKDPEEDVSFITEEWKADYIQTLRLELTKFDTQIADLRRRNGDLREMIRLREIRSAILHQLKEYSQNQKRGWDPLNSRARKKISNALKRAIGSIKKHDPELAAHLEQSLFPFSRPYQYRPDPRVVWLRKPR